MKICNELIHRNMDRIVSASHQRTRPRSSLLPRLAFGAFLIVATSTAAGQAAYPDVQASIQSLFDGMRRGDSTVVRAAFTTDARMGRPVAEDDGLVSFHVRPVDQFVAAAGRPHDAVWDEHIWNVRMMRDGNLASAWMEYAFYLGDALHHCGVNSMQLINRGPGWKIATLIDTDRGSDCAPGTGNE